MTNKDLSKIRKKFKRRLEKVDEKAQTHCGHEGDVQDFFRAQDNLADWVRDEIDRVYRLGFHEGQKKLVMEGGIG